MVQGSRGWSGGLGGGPGVLIGLRGGVGGFRLALVVLGRNRRVWRPRAGARRVRWPQAATGGSGPRATRPVASDGARRVWQPRAAPGGSAQRATRPAASGHAGRLRAVRSVVQNTTIPYQYRESLKLSDSDEYSILESIPESILKLILKCNFNFNFYKIK